MSAGEGSPPVAVAVTSSLSLLAPKFREAVDNALESCHAAGFDAYVYETYRSPELQALYYKRGREIIPPTRPVTNAKSNLYSWHGYGLAVDVISRSKAWSAGDEWFRSVADIFKRHGCKWGGDWEAVDLPHMQWGKCKASPSDRARELIRSGGVQAVWLEVGAAE